MLRALLLIFDPSNTWEKIKDAKPGVARISLTAFLPFLLMSGAIEAIGMMQWGVERSGLGDKVGKAPLALVLRYEAIRVLLILLIVYGGAWVLIHMGASFHRRHTYLECFTTLAYSFTPFLLLRMLDGVPAINTWVCYGIGIFLTISLFYRSIPFILRPDPSNALGLVLFCTFLLLMISALAHFVAVMVLEEKLLA